MAKLVNLREVTCYRTTTTMIVDPILTCAVTRKTEKLTASRKTESTTSASVAHLKSSKSTETGY